MAEIEQVAEIVAKYLRRNTVAAGDVPGVIDAVRAAMSRLGQPTEKVPVTGLTPAISARRSLTEKAITCMDCGWSGQMLKRHLMTAHNSTPNEYRDRWRLANDYPMVALAYSSRRSELAKAAGLGTNRSDRRPGKRK